MLRKLLKYDLKASYLYLLVCYGVYMLLTMAFSLNIKGVIEEEMAGAAYTSAVPETIRAFATISLTLLWGGCIIGLIILTYVLIVRRFYSNLVGDQGYLSLTLPVSTRQHMLSKLISGLLFELLTLAVIVAGAVIMASMIGLTSVVKEFAWLFKAMWEEITSYYGITYYINTVLGAIRGLLMIYFSICVGQLFNKHKVWGAIGTYLGLAIVLDLFVGIATLIVGIPDMSGSLVWMASWSGGTALSMVYKLVQILVYFFLGSWILEKRANLE